MAVSYLSTTYITNFKTLNMHSLLKLVEHSVKRSASAPHSGMPAGKFLLSPSTTSAASWLPCTLSHSPSRDAPLITSMGSITLPRDLDILWPPASHSRPCSNTVWEMGWEWPCLSSLLSLSSYSDGLFNKNKWPSWSLFIIATLSLILFQRIIPQEQVTTSLLERKKSINQINSLHHQNNEGFVWHEAYEKKLYLLREKERWRHKNRSRDTMH